MRRRKRHALAAVVVVALALGAGLWRASPRWSARGEDTGRGVTLRSAPPPQSGASRDSHGSVASDGSGRAASRAGGAGAGGRGQVATRRQAGRAAAPDAARANASEAAAFAQGPRAIYLETGPPAQGFLSSPIGGLDTGAPRALVLWRVVQGHRVRVADGWSDADGALHFPDVLVPDHPLELVVTAAAKGPFGTDRSAPDTLQASDLAPPAGYAARAADGGAALHLTASRALGALVVADAGGAPLARVELPLVPLPGRALVDVPLGARAGGSVLVAQELPDGRRSAWRPVEIPAAAGE